MITRREQEMIDLHEAGLNPGQIAQRMGIKQASVKRTLNWLAVGDAARERKILQRASAELLARIARHHPEQLLMQPGQRA